MQISLKSCKLVIGGKLPWMVHTGAEWKTAAEHWERSQH